MFNSIQLFGLVLLGGLAAGEISKRLIGLPQTAGYLLFGLLIGQSGLNWITSEHIESAQLLVELALGLILFELGYLVPHPRPPIGRQRLLAGLAISLITGALLLSLFRYWGFSPAASVFAASLCLATSPAITIATCSDVGARGEKTGLLYTLVAINGVVAFAAVVLIVPFMIDNQPIDELTRFTNALGSVIGSIVLGGACAGLVLIGAEYLEKQAEHQHLLIIGSIVLGVGTALYLGISVFLPMLFFGLLVSAIDRERKVIPVHIANDARVFLAIIFVLAGAALDVTDLADYWREALLIVLVRMSGQLIAILLARKKIGLSHKESLLLSIGLQPMSSIALLLLVDTRALYSDMDEQLGEMLMATILLMQLLGPLATQTTIKGFGEATWLKQADPADTSSEPAKRSQA